MSTRYNTGNPIESTDVRDMSDNAKNFDDFSNSNSKTFTDRLGVARLTIEGAIEKSGFKPGYGDFATGFTVMSGERNIAWNNPVDKNWYSYIGVIPTSGHQVLPGTNPAGDTDWLPVTDNVLRQELSAIGGVALVGNAADNRGEDFTGPISSPSVTATGGVGGVAITTGGQVNVGGVPVAGDALRDAVVISRVNAGLTNIHGFADRTRLQSVSDYGGYGAFDSTVVIVNSGAMDHTFSFQHRVAYDGTGGGTIGKIAGLLSAPTIYGGTVEEHSGVSIGNPVINPGASLNQNVGVNIGPLFGGVANVGLKMSVDVASAYNIYQDGFSKNYLAGAVGINDSEVGYKAEPLRLKGYGAGAQPMSFNTTSTEAQIGFAPTDSYMKFFTGGILVGQFMPNTTYERAFSPGSDNTQPLGTLLYRWKVVIAGSSAIVTSDEKTKTEIRGLTDQEIAAGVEIHNLPRRMYKLKDSVEEKGTEAARWHSGFIAQDVKAVMEKHGLDPFRYGFFCHDSWPDEYRDVLVNEGETVEHKTTSLVQKMEEREEDSFSFVEENGVVIKKPVKVTTSHPIFEYLPVFNEQGVQLFEDVEEFDDGGNLILVKNVPVVFRKPVMEEVEYTEIVPAEPKYEKVLAREAGDMYSLRYEELLCFVGAALSSR